jgi:hypothetical protein
MVSHARIMLMEQMHQQPTPEFLAEAAQAAARINEQAAGGNVYGDPTNIDPMDAQVFTTPASEALGRVSGAAVVGKFEERDARYVNPSQRGVLYAQYANHDYALRQEAEQHSKFLRDSEDEDEKVSA